MADKKLTVYFTSDLHGYIYPTDYRSRDERDIGLFKCASRFEKDGNTLVIAICCRARRWAPSATTRSATAAPLPGS